MSRGPVIRELECLRCGHEWFPLSPKLPKCCANKKCRSPYWNRPRRVRRTAEDVAKEASRPLAGEGS